MNNGYRYDENQHLAISANLSKLEQHCDRGGGGISLQQRAYATAAVSTSPQEQPQQPQPVATTDFALHSLYGSNAWTDERLLRELLAHREHEPAFAAIDGNLTTFHQATIDLWRYQILAAAESARFDAMAKLAMTTMKKNDEEAIFSSSQEESSRCHSEKKKSSPSPELQHVHYKKTKYDTKSLTTHHDTGKMAASHFPLPPLKNEEESRPELSHVPYKKKTKYATKRLSTRQDSGKMKATSSSSHFPLPLLKEDPEQPPVAVVGKLSFFRKTWTRLERQSDRMDDTIIDQEAFVKEFFLRTVTSYESDHLKRKVAAMKRRNNNQQPFP